MSEASNGLSFRELLLELRADVRSIDAKLDNKADRGRVHDLAATIAAIRLERSAETIIRAAQTDDIRELKRTLDSLQAFRWKISGGVLVVAALAGTLLARAFGAF